MKKICKYFVAILISVFAMFFASQNSVSANYDASKNYTKISLTKEAITITVTYQRGFSGSEHDGDALAGHYVWCEVNPNYSSNDRCAKKTTNSYKFASSDVIVGGPSTYADNNPSTKTFTIDADTDPMLKNRNSMINKTYKIYVTIYFCAVRDKVGDEYGTCRIWDNDNENTITVLEVSGSDLAYNSDYSINTDLSNIKDEGIQKVMRQITDIVYSIVLPVIWGLLGVFLVVKGSLLGVQIVKSADSPEVRQAKIGSLKWLIIGVAISYGATGIIKILENAIKDLVGLR